MSRGQPSSADLKVPSLRRWAIPFNITRSTPALGTLAGLQTLLALALVRRFSNHYGIYEKNRYPSEYMVAAWGEGYFPYLYQKRPDANYDPNQAGNMAWDVYREMWGSHGEFVVDGNLTCVEYASRLPSIKVPTLITVGDHDECDPRLAKEMHSLIPGSKLVILPESGHMTFVDQPRLFLEGVESFLSGSKPR